MLSPTDLAILESCKQTFTGPKFVCECAKAGKLIHGCQSQRTKMTAILFAAGLDPNLLVNGET